MSLVVRVNTVFGSKMVFTCNKMATTTVSSPVRQGRFDFRNESGFQTSKSDSFADDNSTGTLLELESLQALKTILIDFAAISGLKCNTEKTVLMPIGPRVPVPEEIRDLGFCLEDSIHILGMDIDRNLANLDDNFEKTLLNLKKCVQYWSRYNLTLTGRINVIKSLLFHKFCTWVISLCLQQRG